MTEEHLKSVIARLTFGKIQEAAIEYLGELLEQGFDAAKENKFPVHSRFKEIYKEVMEKEGLIDAWLSFICICIFAQGVSVGRGGKQIEKDDIENTKNRICDDKWPKCPVMRLKEFSAALDNVMEWYAKKINVFCIYKPATADNTGQKTDIQMLRTSFGLERCSLRAGIIPGGKNEKTIDYYINDSFNIFVYLSK